MTRLNQCWQVRTKFDKLDQNFPSLVIVWHVLTNSEKFEQNLTGFYRNFHLGSSLFVKKWSITYFLLFTLNFMANITYSNIFVNYLFLAFFFCRIWWFQNLLLKAKEKIEALYSTEKFLTTFKFLSGHSALLKPM